MSGPHWPNCWREHLDCAEARERELARRINELQVEVATVRHAVRFLRREAAKPTPRTGRPANPW